MGIMQIMPSTWAEETDRAGISASPYNEYANIYIGIRYMKRMVRFWKAPRKKGERLELAQASYNAGAGNILKAQAACGDKRTWRRIKPCLKKITGDHAEETIDYVKRIKAWYLGLKRGLRRL
jgi:membrane-bound lytic murein transglycosylase F